MDVNELKYEIVRNGLTVPKLAEIINLDKKTMYSRLKGETSFKQWEISSIANALHLNGEKVLHIFFAEFVS